MAEPENTTVADDDEVIDLPERKHLEGCPMDPDDIEWHETDALAGEHAGHHVQIIRCVRCGGQTENKID